jgi:hypothetical protein
VQCEAQSPERFVDPGNVRERHDEIEVFMLSGYTPEQCVHSPSSGDRRLDPARLQEGQNLQDAFGGHRYPNRPVSMARRAADQHDRPQCSPLSVACVPPCEISSPNEH